MLKQVVVSFLIFIAIAIAQNQNSELSSRIAQQVSALINQTMQSQRSNSTTLSSPNKVSTPTSTSNSQTSIMSCGTDIDCYITRGLAEFILNPLIFGLNGLLTPIVFLVRVLLLIVQFLLNVVLGLVMGLLQSILPSLPLGNTGSEVVTLLKNTQNLLNQLIPLVTTLLTKLHNIPSVNENE